MNTEKPSTEANEHVVESKHTKPILYATALSDEPRKKKVSFRYLNTNEMVKNADLAIPMASVEQVNNQFANSLYGYFIGKRLAFPIVENYVKNT